MATQRRKFTVEHKLQIIQDADQHGIAQTLRKHNLSHSVFNRWRNGFNQGGVSLLQPQYHKVDQELRVLQEENARLKKIIGNQALKLEFKTELLKKAMPTSGSAGACISFSSKRRGCQQAASVVRLTIEQLLLQTLRTSQRHQAKHAEHKPRWGAL